MKYKLTDETKEWFELTLHRIQALRDFELSDGTVIHNGDIGGWIEKESNLSQSDCCWVYGNAEVCGDAQVYDNAEVYGDAQVYDNAQVCGDAQVYGNAWVYGNAQVYDNAQVYGDAQVYDNAYIGKNANIQATSDYMTISPVGSRNDTTTFYKGKDNKIYVKCGCKNTDIGTWLTMVDKTHRHNKHAQAYHLAADIARLRINLEGESE